jgi:serine/threonine-protein kinase
MEFLEGVDLHELVQRRGPLPISDAVDYLLQACEAIAEAHGRGIVHRDLKPSNLLLTHRPDGTPLVKVLDFGISKSHADDDAKLTTTRSVFGSPAYMSPEQVRSAKNVDQRSDVWALGVVLFELLTGQLPFVGDTGSAILAAVAADTPITLRQLVPGSPPELEYAILGCLVKERDRRIGSVRQLAERLAPFASQAGRLSVVTIVRMGSSPHIAPISRPRSFPAAFEPTMPDAASGKLRTDRAVVVASQGSIGKRASLIGLAIIVVAVGITAFMMTFSFTRHPKATTSQASTSAETSQPPPTAAEPTLLSPSGGTPPSAASVVSAEIPAQPPSPAHTSMRTPRPIARPATASTATAPSSARVATSTSTPHVDFGSRQ